MEVKCSFACENQGINLIWQRDRSVTSHRFMAKQETNHARASTPLLATGSLRGWQGHVHLEALCVFPVKDSKSY